MKRTIIQTEEELNGRLDAIIKLNAQLNATVFTDATLLRFAFKDALEKKQRPFVIMIDDAQDNLRAVIPLYRPRGKRLQILWDKTSDYVDVLATDSALGEVKAEFNRLLNSGYSLCFNKIREDARVLKVLEEFRAPLQKTSRAKVESAWAISKSSELPQLNTSDIKRRKSQLKKRGVRVEYVGLDDSDKKIREAILETVYLKYVEFASRNRPYDLQLELDTFVELIFSLVKEGKAFIAKTVNPDSLTEAAVLFFRDSTSVYSILPTYNIHAPHSPGLSLMYHTIEDFLANRNGLVVYDFTIGDESYKKRFSNRTTRIHTIFMSNSIPQRIYCFLMCKALDYIKSTPSVNNLKLKLMNKLTGGKFVLKKFVSKVRAYASTGYLPAIKRFALNKTSAALLFERAGEGSNPLVDLDPDQYKFSQVGLSDIIKFYSKNIPDKYEMWSKINTSVHRMMNKVVPYGIFMGEDLVSVAWVQCSGQYVISEKGVALDLKENECAIFDVMTDTDHRRKGLYNLLQNRMFATEEVKDKRILLHVMSTNIPSIKAHLNLGYVEIKRI